MRSRWRSWAVCASFLAGLDAIEPLAQELDHETMLDLVAVDKGTVHAALLVVPTLTILVVASFGVGSRGHRGAQLLGLGHRRRRRSHRIAHRRRRRHHLHRPGRARPQRPLDAHAPAGGRQLPHRVRGGVPTRWWPASVSFRWCWRTARHRTAAIPRRVLNSAIFVCGLVFVLTITWVRARPALRAQMNEAFVASEARKRARRLAGPDDQDD